MRRSFLVPSFLLAVGCAGGEPPGVKSGDGGDPFDAGDVNLPESGQSDVVTPPTDTPSADDSGARMCRSNDDCTAPDLCTNAQICRNSRCITIGGAANCDDGIACTNDRCDAMNGRCVHDSDDARCPSGQFCDRTAITGGCVSELPCEIGDRSCERLMGNPCMGTWSCDPARLRCVRSRPFSCDDGDMCTSDMCVVMGTTPMCERSGPNYQTDAMNCGRCANRCATAPNATPSCTMGVCALTCNMGFLDLNGDLTRPAGDGGTSDGCECNTAAEDRPDFRLEDTNCDGIDGNASRAVFVAPNGLDTNPGTREMPKRTINAAITVARMAMPVKSVYIANGTYTTTEPLHLAPGVGLYGGYDHTRRWARSLTRPIATIISGPSTAVIGEDIRIDTELQLLFIQAANGTAASPNSVALQLRNSAGISVMGCHVQSGSGALGVAGMSGANGNSGAAGGTSAGGASNCGMAGSAAGGNGGAGVLGRVGGGNGNSGSQAMSGALAGMGGRGGAQGNCNLTSASDGQPGSPGSPGMNGGAGTSGRAPIAEIRLGDTGPIVPALGEAGTPGRAGGGGGGGGAGGGSQHGCGLLNTRCCDSMSGSGGGGGGGGCGGAGGAPGTNGGGSYAIVLINTEFTVQGTQISPGRGGDGGRGGNGGRGGVGGSGGAGAAGANRGGAGAAGGRGGEGGAGGNGPGGAGGSAVGILYRGTPPVQIRTPLGTDFTLVVGSGTAGAGGLGGTNPDASPGANGPPGGTYDTRMSL